MATSSSKKGVRSARPSSLGIGRANPARPFRRSRLETLEPRWTLSAAPTLAALSDVTLSAGTPLYIALDGFDVDGDALTFSVSSTNANLGTTLSNTNRSMRINIAGYGEMVFELFENLAPGTTGRIIELAESDFYDGLTFHRVAEYSDGSPFVIQGGDPDGNGTGGSGVDFDDEFNPLLMHTSKGILSMAKGGDDTNDSQFFITGAATRHLDFNHSVFGYLVEGESVRDAVQNVETDSNSAPLTDVVMSSVEVFLDQENGVLVLSAPHGYTGEGDVTVTISDGNGGTEQRTFHVTVAADSTNSNPYLGPVAPIELNAGGSATATLTSTDVEGDAVDYDGAVFTGTTGIQLSVNGSTGVVTVTAAATAGGIYGIYLGVSNTSNSAWDTQAVPVFVTPAAPTSIELLSSSDTGTSTTDRLTNLNNADDHSLWFRVNGVVSGATVRLYADGTLIGEATATSTSAVVVTNEAHTLADGAHSITAVQGFFDKAVEIGNSDQVVTLESGASAALSITVDATSPMVTSAPVTTAVGGVQYIYDVESDAEAAGGATYSLNKSPSGMLINSQTGWITWTPADLHGDSQEVIVFVQDAAGNQTQHPFEININRPPQIWNLGNQAIEEGSLLTFEVIATDPDATSGIGEILVSLDAGSPAGAAINSNTGVFTWTPTESQGPGSYDVWIRATDTGGATTAQKITITVTEKNESPVLAAIPDVAVDEGALLTVNVAATDSDLPANVLTYSLVSGSPVGAAIDAATGRFTWRPGEAYGGGQYPITIVVTDSAGATDQKTFQVTVNEVDNGPEFRPADVLVATPGSQFRATARAVDPDEVGNAVRYTLEAGAPAGATIDAATGLIRWNVPIDRPSGSVFLTVRATEIMSGGAAGLSSVATLEVQVSRLIDAAFDQAMALAGRVPTLAAQAAREAVDSLLFDSVRTVRFAPAAPVVLREEPALGFRIGTDGGGGGEVETTSDEKDEKDENVKKASHIDEKTPSDEAKTSPADKQSDDGEEFRWDSGAEDDPTAVAELAPRELLDAAMQELADETTAAAVDEALAAR
ncbi:MAG TPA: peptidylprolyl isomerase [Thermoguttaceae bacterium]|nr:peptidylprolyl isomerase [Thermoguttaceae bacterium]